MRSDNQPRKNGFCWSANFKSISRLRENACDKFLNAQGQFHNLIEFKPDPPPADPTAETQDEFFERWKKESGHVE